MNDAEALQMARNILERVMAKTPPGRPAFYSLMHARREIESATKDVEHRGQLVEDEYFRRFQA